MTTDPERLIDDHTIAEDLINALGPLLKKGLNEFYRIHTAKNQEVVRNVTHALNSRRGAVQLSVTTAPQVSIVGLCVPVEGDAFKPVKLFTILIGSADFSDVFGESVN